MLQTNEVQDVDGRTLVQYTETSHDCIEIVYVSKDENSTIHRLKGPAFIRYSKSKRFSIWYKESEIWYNNGVPERKDGPASIIYCENRTPTVELWSEDGFITKQIRYYHKTLIKKVEIFHSKGGSEKTILYDMSGNVIAKHDVFPKQIDDNHITTNDKVEHYGVFVCSDIN